MDQIESSCVALMAYTYITANEQPSTLEKAATQYGGEAYYIPFAKIAEAAKQLINYDYVYPDASYVPDYWWPTIDLEKQAFIVDTLQNDAANGEKAAAGRYDNKDYNYEDYASQENFIDMYLNEVYYKGDNRYKCILKFKGNNFNDESFLEVNIHQNADENWQIEDQRLFILNSQQPQQLDLNSNAVNFNYTMSYILDLYAARFASSLFDEEALGNGKGFDSTNELSNTAVALTTWKAELYSYGGKYESFESDIDVPDLGGRPLMYYYPLEDAQKRAKQLFNYDLTSEVDSEYISFNKEKNAFICRGKYIDSPWGKARQMYELTYEGDNIYKAKLAVFIYDENYNSVISKLDAIECTYRRNGTELYTPWELISIKPISEV